MTNDRFFGYFMPTYEMTRFYELSNNDVGRHLVCYLINDEKGLRDYISILNLFLFKDKTAAKITACELVNNTLQVVFSSVSIETPVFPNGLNAFEMDNGYTELIFPRGDDQVEWKYRANNKKYDCISYCIGNKLYVEKKSFDQGDLGMSYEEFEFGKGLVAYQENDGKRFVPKIFTSEELKMESNRSIPFIMFNISAINK